MNQVNDNIPDETWDIYEWLNFALVNKWKRRCPVCGDGDVKYAIHSKDIVGCELSVRCNNCRKEDCGNNSGEDVKRLTIEWHEPEK